MVHPRFCRSLRARLNLRFFARSVAIWFGGGGLVGGRGAAMGVGGTAKVIRLPPGRLLSPTQFVEHPRLDVAAADNCHVQFCLGKLVAMEQEARRRDRSAGLGNGAWIRRQQSNRFADFRFAHGYDVVDVAADVDRKSVV